MSGTLIFLRRTAEISLLFTVSSRTMLSVMEARLAASTRVACTQAGQVQAQSEDAGAATCDVVELLVTGVEVLLKLVVLGRTVVGEKADCVAMS